jgi:hypothetical protein
MNSFIQSLIRKRALEYQQELGTPAAAPKREEQDDDSNYSSTSFLTYNDDLSSSIRVTILEDNHSDVMGRLLEKGRALDQNAGPDYEDTTTDVLHPPSAKASPLSVMDVGTPTPPRVSSSSRKHSKPKRLITKATSNSSGRTTAKSQPSGPSFSNHHTLRWGEGTSSGTSPTFMPKYPKRPSLSPVKGDVDPTKLPSQIRALASIMTATVTHCEKKENEDVLRSGIDSAKSVLYNDS